MWIIVHALAGLAVGSLLDVPAWEAALLAIAGHILMDLVPHWDYVESKHRVLWATLDVGSAVLALGTAWLLSGWSTALVFGLVSAVPDLDLINAIVPYGNRVRFFPSHWSGFPHGKARPGPGIAVQAVIMAASVLVLLGGIAS